MTLRVRAGVPSLRSRAFLEAFRSGLRAIAARGDFRVVHYSVQGDHVHLIVEAAGKEALARGMKAVASRLARTVQSVFGVVGKVLFGRYHLRILRTPREVRNALAYILLNVRKHWKQRRGEAPSLRLDEASSGRWFDGWRAAPPEPVPRSRAEAREVAHAHTWLLARGWRRHGLIDPAEVPGR